MSFPIVPGKLPKPQVLPSIVYPVRGFLHFAHHPRSLGFPILSSAIKASLLSLLAIVPLAKYGFGPQSRLIARVFQEFRPQHGSWLLGSGITLTTLVLTLVESFAICSKLGDHYVGSVRDRFFDAILDEHGSLPRKKEEEEEGNSSENDTKLYLLPTPEQVVNTLKVAKHTVSTAAAMTLEDAKVRAHHYLSPLNIMILHVQKEDSWALFFLKPILFIGTLPLNLIPVVGPAAFVAIQGLARGGSTHKRYFDLCNWPDAKRQRRIEKAFWQYHRFGMVATLLEMIPFVGFVFSYTNHIGAAMWIMDLKESDKLEGHRFFDLS